MSNLFDFKNVNILVVEDEEILRETLKDDLDDQGANVKAFSNPLKALKFIEKNAEKVDLVISDIKMPEFSGIELLNKIKKDFSQIEVIMITAFGSIDSAIDALKKGAYDYLTKPFEREELFTTINKIIEVRKLKDRNREFLSHFKEKYDFSTFVGESDFVLNLKEQLKILSPSDSNVLITGETGTGKELIANLIHYNSPRKDKLLVKVSCGILSKEVIESELFGHEKGAFTGADARRIGRFEKANGGTIYLDDIDDVPLDVQVKLLRVLQESEIERVGSSDPIKINVRVIASTKKDLLELSKEGKFREDLYYRLNVLPIELKPLRERKSDIIILFKYFLRKYCTKDNLVITERAKNILENYSWPGNIRELKNFAERTAIMNKNKEIDTNIFSNEFFNITDDESSLILGEKSLPEIIQGFERKIILSALKEAEFNKSKAAELLKIPASTLKTKIEKLNITQ